MKRSDIFTFKMIYFNGIFFQILQQNENVQCTPSLGSSPPLRWQVHLWEGTKFVIFTVSKLLGVVVQNSDE